MATTLMQPATHRPSMDHAASFDNRRTSTTSAYDNPSVPRTRTNSINSVSAAAAPAPSQAAYPQQPYANTYFPPANPYPIHQQPTWPAAAVPASSFYAPPFHTYPGTQAPVGFPQGYQQGHTDFSAWAHVYQQMVAGGHMPGPGHLPPPSQQRQPELDDNSETTRSGRSSTEPAMIAASAPKGAQQPQAFHPYKRLPKGAAMPRSQSTDGYYPMSGLANPGKPSRSATADDHRRTGSGSDSFGSISPVSFTSDLAPPPKLKERERPPSVSSQGSSRGSDRGGTRSPAHSAPSRTASPGTATGSTRPSPTASGAVKPTPLAAGPIAANATNAPSASHPSPLSQSATTPGVDATEKKPGAKGRFLGKDKGKEREKAQDTSSRTPSSTKPAPSRVEASATSRAPMAPTKQSLAPPAAPFANPKAMSSDVSLAETERTAATTTASVSGSKPRRGLFRMKNKSSDNISLSSTVSSASMMIRKMGNIGKLARRNSLMGISKIFKEKPKEDDAAPAAPEKDGMFTFKKKSGKKTTAAPATVSHAYAELDRVSEEDDRLLSGLTPAARLARRHTVRSRAEQLKREADRKAEEDAASVQASSASTPAMNEFTGGSAEPTWDKNTTTRVASSLPAVQEADAPKTGPNGANVLHVAAPRTASVVHAVAVNQADYDSADSSDGETIENPSNANRNSAAEDAEFQAVWGKSNIDPALRPKKGILKNNVSNEDLEGMASRQRSNSTNDVVSPAVEGPLSQLPAPLPERIDGNAHASHSNRTGDEQEQLYDPLSPNFSPFDSPSIELDYKPSIYKNPTHNTSAPTLSLGAEHGPGQQIRSMTVPARRRLIWAPECAVYSTYDSMTYDRRSEPATCNRLTPELALQIKQELNAFKLEMPVHPQSKGYTHFFS